MKTRGYILLVKIVQITDHESPLSSSAPQSAVDAAVQTLVMNSSVVGASRLARRVADKEAFRGEVSGEVSGMSFVKYFPGSRAFHLFSSLVEPSNISGISQSETSWYFQLALSSSLHSHSSKC